jgi:hypothetical protein
LNSSTSQNGRATYCEASRNALGSAGPCRGYSLQKGVKAQTPSVEFTNVVNTLVGEVLDGDGLNITVQEIVAACQPG